MPQQQQQNKQRQKMNNRPVHVVRFGAVKAAVWLNQTASGPIHNVTLSRSYKDGDEWRETGSFGADDLLAAAKALDQAHTWIFEQRYSEKSSPEASSDSVP
jgi:hypothetical protein